MSEEDAPTHTTDGHNDNIENEKDTEVGNREYGPAIHLVAYATLPGIHLQFPCVIITVM